MDTGLIEEIANVLGANASDVTIEVRAGGRATVVYWPEKDRVMVGEVESIDLLGPFVAGLKAGVRLGK